MNIEMSVEIDRPPEVVWPVLVNVEHWPDWTSSIAKVERLDRSAFGVGSRVRVRQPRLKTMVWQVSEFDKGRLFAWEAQSPGFFIEARHEIKASARGSVVVLKLEQTGWLASVVSLLFGSLTRRYVAMEAQGLKRQCESLASTN